jgi:hypothetical protein
VVSVLATAPKGCGFEPGRGDGFLRAIKIRSTPSSRMGSKAGRSHVVREILKSHRDEQNKIVISFAHLLLLQNYLVFMLGVSPSRSRLLTRSHSLSSGDSTTGPRPQC